jgi:hypothetical protein
MDKFKLFRFSHKDWEVSVGDEKKEDFFPRVKVKKWNNEVNLSLGIKHSGGDHTVDGKKIVYTADTLAAHFYPITSHPEFNTDYIRFIDAGLVDPITFSAQYEVDRYIDWPEQTIVFQTPDRPLIGYYGHYPADNYVGDIDIAENRISAPVIDITGNNPLYLDQNMALIDIHYHPERDDIDKIDRDVRRAIIDIVGKYAKVSEKGDKLYIEDGDRIVKFFSTAAIDGHYYFYININCDYNKVYSYYKKTVPKDVRDEYAYGLASVIKNLPDDLIYQIITKYAEHHGLPLVESKFTDEELAIIEKLKAPLSTTDWIRNGIRDDVHLTSALNKPDGYEFEVHLLEKPKTNIVSLSVRSKGLKFYYQGEITDDFEHQSRDPNVVGSYAAYHIDKSNNQYQSGKAFHLYRPWAQDANGTQVWCEYDPDWDGVSDLNITVPESFLETAQYPVLIDPTFGYLNSGASTYLMDNQGVYYVSLRSKAPSFSGSIVSYGAFIASGNGMSVEAATFSGALSAIDYTASGGASNTITSAANALIAAGTNYNIGLYVNNPTLNTPGLYVTSNLIKYDTGASGSGGTATPSSYPALSIGASEPTVSLNNYLFSLYITYTTNQGYKLVQSASVGATALTTTALSLNWTTATPTPGNLIIVSIHNDTNKNAPSAVTDSTTPTANAFTPVNTAYYSNNISHSTYAMIVPATINSTNRIVKVTSNNTTVYVSMYEFSGNYPVILTPASISPLIDNSQNPTPYVSSSSITTTQGLTQFVSATKTNDLLFTSISVVNTVGTAGITTTGATTLIANTGGTNTRLQDAWLNVQPGTYQPYFTWTTSRPAIQATTLFLGYPTTPYIVVAIYQANSSSIAIPTPSQGNILVIMTTNTGVTGVNPTITDSAGGTWTTSSTKSTYGSTNQITFSYKVASGTETSVQATATGQTGGTTVYYELTEIVSPGVAYDSGTGGPQANPNIDARTTAGTNAPNTVNPNGALILVMTGFSTSTYTYAWTAGASGAVPMISVSNGNNPSVASWAVTTTPYTALQFTANWATSTTSGQLMVVLKKRTHHLGALGAGS